MIPALMAALALMQQPVCAAPPGAALLWADPATRFGFIGETHGTTETPAAFAEIVCEAGATRPVVVALEMPEGMQPDLDAWMTSDGGEAARATFLAHDYWDPAHADGRSSAAMFAMLERVRALKASGRDLTLRAYQPSTPRPDGFDQSYYENEMAVLLIHAAYTRPDALVLALGGSLHARKTVSPRHGFLFAAGHLKSTDIVSLRTADQGGRTWACFGEAACGDSDLGTGDFDRERRGVILGSQDGDAWDGLLALGPATASPPARTVAAR
jgi:hypothetical protein